MRRTEEGRALGGDDQLRVFAFGELRQRVELKYRDECGIRRLLLYRRVHRRNGLGATFSLEDLGLAVTFGAKNGRLLGTLCLLDRGLTFTVGDVHRRLLLSF